MAVAPSGPGSFRTTIYLVFYCSLAFVSALSSTLHVKQTRSCSGIDQITRVQHCLPGVLERMLYVLSPVLIAGRYTR